MLLFYYVYLQPFIYLCFYLLKVWMCMGHLYRNLCHIICRMSINMHLWEGMLKDVSGMRVLDKDGFHLSWGSSLLLEGMLGGLPRHLPPLPASHLRREGHSPLRALTAFLEDGDFHLGSRSCHPEPLPAQAHAVSGDRALGLAHSLKESLTRPPGRGAWGPEGVSAEPTWDSSRRESRWNGFQFSFPQKPFGIGVPEHPVPCSSSGCLKPFPPQGALPSAREVGAIPCDGWFIATGIL